MSRERSKIRLINVWKYFRENFFDIFKFYWIFIILTLECYLCRLFQLCCYSIICPLEIIRLEWRSFGSIEHEFSISSSSDADKLENDARWSYYVAPLFIRNPNLGFLILFSQISKKCREGKRRLKRRWGRVGTWW